MPANALPTVCTHNGMGQVTVEGGTTQCRMCGCWIQLPYGVPSGTAVAAVAEAAAPPAIEYPAEAPPPPGT